MENASCTLFTVLPSHGVVSDVLSLAVVAFPCFRVIVAIRHCARTLHPCASPIQSTSSEDTGTEPLTLG